MLDNLYTPKVIVALMALILAVNGVLLYQLQTDSPVANTPERTPQNPPPPQQLEDEEQTTDRDDPDEGNRETNEEDEPDDKASEEGKEDEENEENRENGGNGGNEEQPEEDENQQNEEPENPESENPEPENPEAEEQNPQGGEGSTQEGQRESPGAEGSKQGQTWIVEGAREEGQPDDAPAETPFASQYNPPPTNPGDGIGGDDAEFASSDGSGGGLDRIQVALAALYDPDGSGGVRILPTTGGSILVPVALFVGTALIGAAGIIILHRK